MYTKKKNEMKTELKKFLGLSAVWMSMLACSQVSFAQNAEFDERGSGNSGGGNITEADLRYYMGKLDSYLSTSEGRTAFPEIVAYDEAHPTEKFHDLLLNTKPVVQASELRDSNGVVRDCMSYANPGNRYFVCNLDALPNKTLENQPSFYRIVLHELFVQAGIEKPLSKEVRSVYDISSRITQNVHLETYQEWVPGKEKFKPEMVADVGMVCSDDVDFGSMRKSIVFLLQPNGDYALVERIIPYLQDKYSPYHYQGIKQKVVLALSRKVKVNVLARGNSNGFFVKEYPSSPYFQIQHADQGLNFLLRMTTELKKAPRWDNEFLAWISIWKKGPTYASGKVKNLKCVGEGNSSKAAFFVDFKAIFENKNKQSYEYDWL